MDLCVTVSNFPAAASHTTLSQLRHNETASCVHATRSTPRAPSKSGNAHICVFCQSFSQLTRSYCEKRPSSQGSLILPRPFLLTLALGNVPGEQRLMYIFHRMVVTRVRNWNRKSIPENFFLRVRVRVKERRRV